MLRRLVGLTLVVGTLAVVVATARATPPLVTLTSPSGHTDVNPPALTGVGGRGEGISNIVWVEVYSGDLTPGSKPVAAKFAPVNESTGAFTVVLDDALPDGTYTARATQRANETEVGTSNVLSFRIGKEPDPTPTPSPSPSPTATPVVQSATATPTPAATPAATPDPPAPYVCKSRRDFIKHIHKPRGAKHFKIAATLNGKPWPASIIGAKQLLVRLDLRGFPKDTYTLRVAVTYTRKDGTRVTTNSVTRVDYHTCVPRAA
jgi:hypothetical protein